MINVTKVEYKGWKNCYKISNDIVEVIVTSDIGPRIIRYGFIGRENHFKNFEEVMGKSNQKEWELYGGHRLWHSPEEMPRSYSPDNSPIKVEILEDGVIVTQPIEESTRIRKSMKITLDESSSLVTIEHFLKNKNLWEIEFAIWALTVMATGGLEIVPQEQENTDLLPNRMLSLWPYTKLNDPRVTWGEKYIFLQQDTTNKDYFKFGISNTSGWAAYANYDQLFVKKFDIVDNAIYPDYHHSNYETYTRDDMIELESLSPIYSVGVNETISHTECWKLFDNIKKPLSEKDVDETILPLL